LAADPVRYFTYAGAVTLRIMLISWVVLVSKGLSGYSSRHEHGRTSQASLGSHPREREKFFKAILALEENEPPRLPVKTKRVKWPDVEARAKRISGSRILPNLILLERDEEAF
jgi:hypothetical protein